MVGLVVVTHGKLGMDLVEELEAMLRREKRSENEVVAIMKKVAFVSVGPDDDFEETLHDIEARINKVKKAVPGDCVLILTDMFGGTPCNRALTAKDNYPSDQIDVVAGVNLPMLYKLATARDGMALKDVATFAENSGRAAIKRGVLVSGVAYDRIIALEGVCAEECAGRHCVCKVKEVKRPEHSSQHQHQIAPLAWAA